METYINNNKKPEITVIIPSYNVKEYIEECLESLKNQTFTDFEVLCVDDGSNDGTADIIKEYAVSDPRFQYVSMDHCGKAGLMRTTRNAGKAKKDKSDKNGKRCFLSVFFRLKPDKRQKNVRCKVKGIFTGRSTGNTILRE